MIKKTLAIALACITAATAAVPAYAHDRDHGRHDRGRHEWRDHGPRGGWRGPDRVVVHRDVRVYEARPHFYGPRVYGPPVGYSHAWVRGERLPAYYRGGTYVVSDWRAHRLYQPQPGYQWVQVGSQYMMVALATGIIAGIMLAH